jgi:hypothetical protein
MQVNFLPITASNSFSSRYPKENVVVATSSFQEVPSNKKPLINLTVNGILRPSEEKVHEIKMIFDSDIPEKDNLSQSYGTFVLCKGVYNARKIVKTAWDKETSTLTVIIDLSREKIRPKRPAQFSFSIQINDAASCKYTFSTLGALQKYTVKCTNTTASCCQFTTFTQPGGESSFIFSGKCRTKSQGKCQAQTCANCVDNCRSEGKTCAGPHKCCLGLECKKTVKTYYGRLETNFICE